MADIGSTTKLINLWPARPSRSIEQFSSGKQSSQKRKNKEKNKQEAEHDKDAPGNTIDEYA